MRLAEVVAGTLDAMSNEERQRMLGQTARLLLKVLTELEDRRRKRAESTPRPARVENPVDAMRRAHGPGS